MNTEAGLINTILGSQGVGERLMEEWGDIPTLVKNIDAAKVTEIQRSKLKAVMQIHFVRENPVAISSPFDIFEMVKDLQAEPQEHLVVLVFDQRNHLLHRENLYKGSVNSSQVRVAEILRPAIIRRASAIVLVHNHPSGDPTPSPDDVAVTRSTQQACRLMDISLLDHIVVGAGRFVSLKERGLGFN